MLYAINFPLILFFLQDEIRKEITMKRLSDVSHEILLFRNREKFILYHDFVLLNCHSHRTRYIVLWYVMPSIYR